MKLRGILALVLGFLLERQVGSAAFALLFKPPLLAAEAK